MFGLKLENLKSWKRMSCLIAVIGTIQMIALTLIAMILYPDGYSFSEHYFSHLGLAHTPNGLKNSVCQILFIIALVGAAVGLIPFWIVMTTIFSKLENIKYLSYFGSILGLLSSPFLIGVAIFPGDTQGALHSISAKYFFLLFALAILFYSIAIFFNKDYQNIYAIVGIIFFVIIVLFILRFFSAIGPIMQKSIIYSFCLWGAFQITKIWKEVGI
ncbi:MAG: DUF998 domain-containing protein [Candidatus Hermodarchaeota archaeon]